MLAIYTRLSKDDPASNSIKNQTREGKEFAINNNFKKHEIYDEGEGVSGGSELNERPELRRLIGDIYNDIITDIWFRHQDRLERNTATFLLFTDAVRAKKAKVFIGNNPAPVDYTDPNSYFMGGLMSWFNSYLILKQSYLTENAIRKNYELGYVHGVPPYGYKRKSKENPLMIIDEEEAKVVKRIFKLSLEGNGFKSIAKQLNQEKIPTTYNKIGKGEKKAHTKWSDGSVRGIIKNEIYKGVRISQKFNKDKESVVYDNIEPILEPYYWDKVNRHLKDNMNSGEKETIHKYLLNNVNVCGVCGKPYSGRALPNKNPLYRCVSKRNGKHHCGNGSSRLKSIDDLIWDVYFKKGHIISLIDIEYKWDKHIMISANAAIEAGKLNKEKEELLGEKKNLVRAVAKGDLKPKDTRELIDELEDKINTTMAKIDEQKELVKKHTEILDNHIIKKEELEDFDRIDSFEEKQRLIDKYIKEITITKLPKQHIKMYIHFYGENMESDILVVDRFYKWTYEPNRMHLVDMDGNHFDPKLDVKMIREIDEMFLYYKDLYENKEV